MKRNLMDPDYNPTPNATLFMTYDLDFLRKKGITIKIKINEITGKDTLYIEAENQDDSYIPILEHMMMQLEGINIPLAVREQVFQDALSTIHTHSLATLLRGAAIQD